MTRLHAGGRNERPTNGMAMLPKEDKRTVLHLDLDAFFVSVEVLRDSRLQGLPLIIGGNSDRGVVASCSYEARKFGVHSAMPIRMAKRLCPQATIISGDMEAYSNYSRLVTDIIHDSAPSFEKSSIDEFYLDLTGMDRFFGNWKWSLALRQKIICESGLPISFGLSTNKMVAKVATSEAKPNGKLHVPAGHERPFLDPLSIRKIPMIGDKTYRTLRNMGVQRVITLRQIPRDMMERLLGQSGRIIWQRANAIDNSPVVPYTEAKSISTEHTFEQDTINLQRMRAVLLGMTEKLGFKLREQQKLTGCITVKLRYANFDTVTRQATLPYTANDQLLIEQALTLFDRLYDRRMRIRLLGVRLSHLIQGRPQIDLFQDTQKEIHLYQAIDRMKRKYGAQAIQRAKGLGEAPRTTVPQSAMKG